MQISTKYKIINRIAAVVFKLSLWKSDVSGFHLCRDGRNGKPLLFMMSKFLEAHGVAGYDPALCSKAVLDAAIIKSGNSVSVNRESVSNSFVSKVSNTLGKV